MSRLISKLREGKRRASAQETVASREAPRARRNHASVGPGAARPARSRTDDPRTWTLLEGRAWLEANAIKEGGVYCPCCNRKVEVRRRAFNTNQFAFVQWLAREHRARQTTKVDVSPYTQTQRGGDYGKAQLWGLVERHKDGRWSLTSRGLKFLQGKVKIPKFVFVYNNKPAGFSEDEKISVREFL